MITLSGQESGDKADERLEQNGGQAGCGTDDEGEQDDKGFVRQVTFTPHEQAYPPVGALGRAHLTGRIDCSVLFILSE